MGILWLLACMSAGTWTVAPNGNDAWEGTSARPFRTLARAVREASGKPGSKIRLKTGLYRLSEPVRLRSDHSQLTVEAAPGARPVLTGSVAVTGWRADGRYWVAKVPKEVAERGSRMFTIGGEIRPRARWPLSGTLQNLSKFDVRWMSTTGGGWERKPTEEELTTMLVKASDLPPDFGPASAEVTVYHMWDESCVGVRSYDPGAGRFVFSSPLGHPAGAFGVQKYALSNVRAGLTAPGSWFLDRTKGEIVYHPKPSERPDQVQAELALADTLIRIEGTESAPARGVTIRNLTLAGANNPVKAGGFGSGEYDGALTAARAPSLVLEGLRVQRTAGWGIRVWSCPDARILRCDVDQTGAGGIRAEGDKALVQDCVVSRVGLLYPSGAGLWFGGKASRISHNTIRDTTYSGIIGAGEDSIIENNLIERAMTVLHDGAGLYFGFTRGVKVRGNVIRDIVDTGGYGASAYYLDEQAENCVVEGNLSLNVARPSQNHMAKNNAIRDNVFVNAGEMSMAFARCSGYTVERNALIAEGALKMTRPNDGWASFANNALQVRSAQVVTLKDYAEESSQLYAGGEGSFLGPAGKLLSQKDGYTFVPSSEAKAAGIRMRKWVGFGARRP